MLPHPLSVVNKLSGNFTQRNSTNLRVKHDLRVAYVLAIFQINLLFCILCLIILSIILNRRHVCGQRNKTNLGCSMIRDLCIFEVIF